MSVTYAVQIEMLNDLIGVALDTANNYAEAAGHARSASLRRLFEQRSAHRMQLATILQTEVRVLGGCPADQGSVFASTRRMLVGLKTLVGSDDAGIVERCIAGERLLKRKFEQAVKKGLEAPLDGSVARIHASILADHDQLLDIQRTLDPQSERVIPFNGPTLVPANDRPDSTFEGTSFDHWVDDTLTLLVYGNEALAEDEEGQTTLRAGGLSGRQSPRRGTRKMASEPQKNALGAATD